MELLFFIKHRIVGMQDMLVMLLGRTIPKQCFYSVKFDIFN